MRTKKIYRVDVTNNRPAQPKRKVRKYLNADTLIQLTRKDFQQIPDHRAGNSKVTLDDALMSALALFQLKDPSLLAFDKRRREELENLHSIWRIAKIPYHQGQCRHDYAGRAGTLEDRKCAAGTQQGGSIMD